MNKINAKKTPTIKSSPNDDSNANRGGNGKVKDVSYRSIDDLKKEYADLTLEIKLLSARLRQVENTLLQNRSNAIEKQLNLKKE